MKPKVYIETTVISYLTARPSRDVVVAGHQQTTREWWRTCRDRFDLVASQLVLGEAAAGDPEAARERLEVLGELNLLEVTLEASALARHLIESAAIPAKAAQDALHLGLAVTNGVGFLVTWNCRHLANAVLRTKIEETCRAAGYEPVVLCTPEELMED
jgi:predicted nucleic acid-binding protein